MNERVLQTLEFDKVLIRLAEYASTSLGKEKVQKLKPLSNYMEAEQAQKATAEGVTVLRLKGSVPLGGIHDVRPAAKRASIGGVLPAKDLLDLADTIGAGRRLKKFLFDLCDEESLPILQSLSEGIEGLKQLEDEIRSCIDDHGEILDSASPELRRVRQEIRGLESSIKQKLEQIIRTSSYQKMLQEAVITIRNDRYVIPVKQEYRGNFGGLIHDQSASGATLFIEPQAIVQFNNQLREAKLREEKEIEKILRQLSNRVAEVADAIINNVEILGEMDFIFTKAKYAQAVRATKPILNEERYIRLKKGRHPLISMDQVVPIDVELGKEYSMLVITGPNTGGKTVSLKTIGLITLMAQAGLFIPCNEESEVAVFDEVFADIGDEQSIEQNLSTFSSHLTNIIRILEGMTHNSLILLDELGAGTDPTEGAALAIAILDYIHHIGARVVATTHYKELKAYAYNRADVMNASVEFDVESLRPTYRLLIGVPGRSNAFAIAARLGLHPAIIEKARKNVDTESQQVETMIATLEENRRGAEEERRQAEVYRQEIERLRKEMEKERERFEAEKDRILQKAREEARNAVKKAKEEADSIIAELRRLQQEEGARVKDHQLIEAKKRLEAVVPDWERKPASPQTSFKGKGNKKIKPGDEVHVHSLGLKGTVVEQAGKEEYIVQIGIMKSKIHRNDLQVVEGQKQQAERSFTRVKSNRDTIRTELDVRGLLVEDAIIEIDKYLDEAILAGLNQVTIIHGLGTGALRKGVQEYLRSHRSVKNMRLGVHGEGGSGVTVIELK